jgi:hypothetical protein
MADFMQQREEDGRLPPAVFCSPLVKLNIEVLA